MGLHTDIVKKMRAVRVLVIGDIMLDRFVYGDVGRISPEAPVPVLRIQKENKMLGGAGNVLTNLHGLGAQTVLVSATGDDEDGHIVSRLVKDYDVDTAGLIPDPSRPTNVKTRFISGTQQLLRTDYEDTKDVSADIEQKIVGKVKEILKDVQVVILSDYNKGVLTQSVIKAVIKEAKKLKVPVLVDPKGTDYSIYKGAGVVTPNKKELSQSVNDLPTGSDEDVQAAADKLISYSGIDSVVATRAADGISVVQKNKQAVHIPTRALEVFDVSGAGDTVIATLAAALGAGADLVTAAELANKAGGIVVGKAGTAPIHEEELLADPANGKELQAGLYGWEEAKTLIRKWQGQGLRVGFTNGCFDIIHHGHVSYLNEARARCDRLILGLNHDASVRILKGESRPINDEKARASVIGALGSIDMVVLFGAEKDGEDNTPCAVIDFLRPDVIFKGGDYTIDQLPEAKVAMAYGGEAVILNLFEGYSTTNIIEKSDEAA